MLTYHYAVLFLCIISCLYNIVFMPCCLAKIYIRGVWVQPFCVFTAFWVSAIYIYNNISLSAIICICRVFVFGHSYIFTQYYFIVPPHSFIRFRYLDLYNAIAYKQALVPCKLLYYITWFPTRHF